MACVELCSGDSTDASSVAGELQHVRAKRNALERAHGLASASSKHAALLRVQRVAADAEELQSSLRSLETAARTSAAAWEAGVNEARSATAQLHQEQARYFEIVSRTLPAWREQTARTLRAQAQGSRGFNTATPDLFGHAADQQHSRPQPRPDTSTASSAEVRY